MFSYHYQKVTKTKLTKEFKIQKCAYKVNKFIQSERQKS